MIDIVPSAPGDFLEIAALDRLAWRQNRNSEFIPDGEHVWRIWCEHALTFVARRDGEIVGAVLAFACTDGGYCLHKAMVSEACRGHGVGSRLFESLLSKIDGMGVDVFLTVDPVNEGAIKLYEKWGFTDHKFVKGYYRDNEDRLVLTRRFAGSQDA